MSMERRFLKEMKKDSVRLWIMQEGEFVVVYFYHNNFPTPIDKEVRANLEQAEQLCQEFLYPQSVEHIQLAV